MKRINIAMEEKAYLRVKVIAAIKGIPINEYLVQCLERQTEEEGVGRKR